MTITEITFSNTIFVQNLFTADLLFTWPYYTQFYTQTKVTKQTLIVKQFAESYTAVVDNRIFGVADYFV